MIGARPRWFLRETLRRWSGGAAPSTEEAIREYVRCFSDPAAIHASCEDYRAAATIDLVHDARRRRRRASPARSWCCGARTARCTGSTTCSAPGARAADGRGRALPCGHFLPEEARTRRPGSSRAFFLAGEPA